MSKAQTKTVAPVDATTAKPASASAPVAATSAADARKAEIAVSKETSATPKKSAFEVQVEARAALFALTGAELLARASGMKDAEAKDTRVFRINEANVDLKDQIVGTDLSRSGIRSAVIDFLRSREGNQAAANEIAAYMQLAQGIAHSGKFNVGYLCARDPKVRRGMVAREQLTLVTPPVVEAAPAE